MVECQRLRDSGAGRRERGEQCFPRRLFRNDLPAPEGLDGKIQRPAAVGHRPLRAGPDQARRHIQRAGPRHDLDYRRGHVLHRSACNQRCAADQLRKRQSTGRLQIGAAAYPSQSRGALLYLLRLLVSNRGAALVRSGHANPLPRGRGRPGGPAAIRSCWRT